MSHGKKRNAEDEELKNEEFQNEPTPSKRPSFQGGSTLPAGKVEVLDEALTMASMPSHWQSVYTLGKGTFGHVVLVHTNQLNSSGLHYIHNEFVTKHMNVTADKLWTVVNEVKMHRKCRDHPNILFCGLCLYQLYETNRYRVQMCLEYAACGDMCILAQKPKHEQHVAYVCEGVLKALEHVHSFDIVHGDISLKNVLMTHTGVIKLCDFGCARLVEHAKRDTSPMIVGTPGFIAPEVMKAKGYDTKADVWNLASFTFHLKSGNNPFKTGATFDLESYGKQIQNNYTPEMPTDFTSNLKDFIKRMYSYEPTERDTPSQMLQHDFLKEKVSQQMISIQYKRLRSAYGVDLPYPDESQPTHVPVSIENM